MHPKRIRRKRTKGWRIPDSTVFVGRPSRFGNPFRITDYSNPYNLPKESLQRFAVSDYESLLADNRLGYTVDDIKGELKGKNLACWCKEGTPCHADILLKIANS